MSEIDTTVKKTVEEVEREYQEKMAQIEKDKANLVEEIKAERSKKQQAIEEAEKLKQSVNHTGDNPAEIVERVLKQKEEESVKDAFNTAKEEIRKAYNEFNPETDTAGIVFNKFENELSKFNFSGLKTKEQIKDRMNEVYEFINRKKPEVQGNFHSGTKPDTGNIKTFDSDSLSDAETKLIRDFGYTKEKYLQIKAKRPNFVASLLKQRS